jgi:hypothetical protein
MPSTRTSEDVRREGGDATVEGETSCGNSGACDEGAIGRTWCDQQPVIRVSAAKLHEAGCTVGREDANKGVADGE